MIAPGLRIGRYEIGARLGKGGFGVVHVARDVELDRDIAIKVLKPEYLTRPQVVQRFIKEARAAAKIGHPGIVTVYECGQIAGTGTRADGNAYIAMELLRGQSLADRLADRGRLPAASVIEIGRQLAAALAVAHGAGIIHRDLKPDNIYLVPDAAVHGGERVKILDFGVAKLAEPGEGVHTHSQMLLGTPRYMPPEQARSAARVDHRSDIYTLGCILFEMLCGRAPYSGDSGDQIVRHQTSPIPSARDVVADAPAHLDKLIHRMLAKSPDDRPQSMVDIDDALAGDADLETTIQRPTLAKLREPTPAVEDTTTTTTTVSEGSTVNQRAKRARIVIGAAIAFVSAGVATWIALRDDKQPTPIADDTPPAVVIAPAPAIPVEADAGLVEERAVADGCDADQLKEAAQSAFTSGNYGGALAQFEASYECRSNADTAMRAFITACNLKRLEPAKKWFTRLSGAMQHQTKIICIRNGITEADLMSDEPAREAQAIVSQCREAADKRDWTGLINCSEQFVRFDAAKATALRVTAIREAKAEARFRALSVSLTSGDFKVARAELDEIPTTSVYRKAAQDGYDHAVEPLVRKLIADANKAKDDRCEKFQVLMRQIDNDHGKAIERMVKTRITCTGRFAGAKQPCDADEIKDDAQIAFTAGNYAEALKRFEESHACRPQADTAMRAFIAACNLKRIPAAKKWFQQLSSAMANQTKVICIRNGIREDDLKP